MSVAGELLKGSWKARNEGKGFENLFELRARQEGILPRQHGLEAEWRTKGKGWFLAEKASHCDFDLFWEGKAAVVDCKSREDGTLPHSAITRHQLEKLALLGEHVPTGYVVCFRSLQKVVFFPWHVLMGLRPGASLRPEDGVLLGDLMNFSVREIFKTLVCKPQDLILRNK